MNRVPDAVLYEHIFTYLHIEEVFRFSGVSIDLHTKVINDYIGGKKKIDCLIRKRCKQRKKEKQQFFYNHIYNLPIELIYTSFAMTRVFCYIDDLFHNTTFTNDILQWNNFYLTSKRLEYLTDQHEKFYQYCVEEIQFHYNGLIK